jgi:hypothetical protein
MHDFDADKHPDDQRGQCHRHAPQPSRGQFEQEILEHLTTLAWKVSTAAEQETKFNNWEGAVNAGVSWWPGTFSHDWCGDFVAKPDD